MYCTVLYCSNCSILYCVKVVHPKSDEQRQRLNDAVKHILLFRSLEQVLVALSPSLSVSLCLSLSVCVSVLC